ncbi:MAG TPA: histidine kinase [Candidatus Dormibacteraeota bacterium]
MAILWQRRNTYVAWACVVVTLVLYIAGSAFIGATPKHLIPSDIAVQVNGWWGRLSLLYILAFVVVGALIVARRPGNRVGWVCCAIGLFTAFYTFVSGYSLFGTLVNPQLPALGLIHWLSGWSWSVPVTLALFFLPLLFPDGRPLSPWMWLAGAAVVIGFALAFAGRPIGEFLAITGNIAAIASLVIRYQRGGPDEKQQIRWFALALVVVAIVSIAGVVVGLTVYHNSTVVFNPYFDVLIPLAFTGLAISIGIAVMRYRLYDIDVFIRQALVYGALVVIISIVYFITVVSVGSRLGVPRNDPAGAVAIGAMVALAFQPLRRLLQRLASRLVYGKRATPYEVLSRFSHQMGDMVASDELPRQMARVLAEGTGADRATVWLRVGDELRQAASWPEVESRIATLPLSDGELPPIAGAAESVPVRYQGELLGALAVAKRQPMSGTERRLLSDLGQESGLVLKNARLTAELVQRLDELQASRERLITAQDTARRQLERNIHDGAQQNLVALKLKIALARRLAESNPVAAQAALDELTGETNEAIETLRELARGLYPPILAQEGLVAAIESQARRLSIPVEVSGGPLPRLPQEMEASVYFCVLEALQNVAKHSGASRASVSVEQSAGRLVFSVADDGRGLDPAKAKSGSGMQNMRDRVEVLGGRFQVESSPGAGTRVVGSIPFDAADQASASRSGSKRDLAI